MSIPTPIGFVSLKDAVDRLGEHLFGGEWTGDEWGSRSLPASDEAARRESAYKAEGSRRMAKAQEERRLHAERARKAALGVMRAASPKRVEAFRARRKRHEKREAAELASRMGWDPSWPDPSSKEYRQEFGRRRRLDATIEEFRRRMYATAATAVLIDQTTGQMHDVPSHRWLAEGFPVSLELSTGSMPLHHDWRPSVTVAGLVCLRKNELGALVSAGAKGSGAAKIAANTRCIKDLETEVASQSKPQAQAPPPSDLMEQQHEDSGHTAAQPHQSAQETPGVGSSRSARQKGASQPSSIGRPTTQIDAAKRALRELYPKGVPKDEKLVALMAAVNEHLNGVHVSQDTVRRARKRIADSPERNC